MPVAVPRRELTYDFTDNSFYSGFQANSGVPFNPK
jgi:hypothetical protein